MTKCRIRVIHFVFTFGCLLLLLICFGKTVVFATTDTNAGSKPIEVRIAIQVDQITEVNQKAENFAVVGNFIMIWQDSRFAFDQAECECENKIFSSSQFESFTRENELTWPRFLFDNQQGKRWIQEEVFLVRPRGQRCGASWGWRGASSQCAR